MKELIWVGHRSYIIVIPKKAALSLPPTAFLGVLLGALGGTVPPGVARTRSARSGWPPGVDSSLVPKLLIFERLVNMSHWRFWSFFGTKIYHFIRKYWRSIKKIYTVLLLVHSYYNLPKKDWQFIFMAYASHHIFWPSLPRKLLAGLKRLKLWVSSHASQLLVFPGLVVRCF